MEWRALPPVDWWVVIGGILWPIFWVTVVVVVAVFLAWAFLHLTDRSEGLVADPLQLSGKRYARGEISHEGFEEVRRELGGTSSPDRVRR
jgi:uncharacterized membrane protein